MKLRYKVVGVAVLLLTLRSCFLSDVLPPKDALTLKPNEQAKVTLLSNKIVKTKRNIVTGKTDSIIVPNYGHGSTVVVKKDGSVDVKAKEFGLFDNDFGLSTDFRSIGVATELMYWRRLSLLGGSHFINLKDSSLQLNLFVAAGYRLPFAKLNNFSTYVGMDTDRKIIFGLFLRFGSN